MFGRSDGLSRILRRGAEFLGALTVLAISGEGGRSSASDSRAAGAHPRVRGASGTRRRRSSRTCTACPGGSRRRPACTSPAILPCSRRARARCRRTRSSRVASATWCPAPRCTRGPRVRRARGRRSRPPARRGLRGSGSGPRSDSRGGSRRRPGRRQRRGLRPARSRRGRDTPRARRLKAAVRSWRGTGRRTRAVAARAPLEPAPLRLRSRSQCGRRCAPWRRSADRAETRARRIPAAPAVRPAGYGRTIPLRGSQPSRCGSRRTTASSSRRSQSSMCPLHPVSAIAGRPGVGARERAHERQTTEEQRHADANGHAHEPEGKSACGNPGPGIDDGRPLVGAEQIQGDRRRRRRTPRTRAA